MAGSWVILIVVRAAIFDFVIPKMGTRVFLGSFQYHFIYIIFDWMLYRRGVHEAHKNFGWMWAQFGDDIELEMWVLSIK